MKKIISLFIRDFAGKRLALNEVTPGAEWVIAGEGIATRKWDGTACAIIGGKLYKRRECKRMSDAPPDYIPSDPNDDINKHFGWVPVTDDPSDQWHRAGWTNLMNRADGTYELVGVGVQGNVEQLGGTFLVRHGEALLTDAPRTFDDLHDYLSGLGVEGIVWHHPDGRMVKIKAKDFQGVSRGIKRKAVAHA